MVQVILLHSVLGLRQVEHEIASAWRAAGHEVALPDLYRGRTAKTYDDGFRLKDSVGEAAMRARLADAVRSAHGRVVLAGVSLGAHLLGEHWGRANVIGAILLCGVARWMEPRRPRFPVTAHVARPDPFDSDAYFEGWAADAGSVDLAFYRYEGAGHYFLDASGNDFDLHASAVCLARTQAFLARL